MAYCNSNQKQGQRSKGVDNYLTGCFVPTSDNQSSQPRFCGVYHPTTACLRAPFSVNTGPPIFFFFFFTSTNDLSKIFQTLIAHYLLAFSQYD